MKANENNFVDLIRKRREEGILYVIETYSGLLHSIVRKRLFMAPDRIDECMNDIFLGIWKNIDSFDESRGNFAGWAAGVAKLEAIDTLRKIQRESRMQTVSLEDVEIPKEDEAFQKLAEQELSEETMRRIRSCSKGYSLRKRNRREQEKRWESAERTCMYGFSVENRRYAENVKKGRGLEYEQGGLRTGKQNKNRAWHRWGYPVGEPGGF